VPSYDDTSDHLQAYYHADGTKLEQSPEELRALFDKIYRIIDGTCSRNIKKDKSIKHTLKKHNWHGLKEEVFNLLTNTAFENRYGQNIEKLSVKQHHQAVEFLGDQMLFKDGYLSLLKTLAAELNIQLNTKVTNIDYTQRQVIITDENSNQYLCDNVIVTIPV
jgi:hypothetical protein